MKNRFKKLGLIVILTTILMLLSVQPATAGFISGLVNLASTTIGNFYYVIAYILSVITGLFFAFCAFFINIALKLNLSILDQANQLVYVGWGAVREIANLGFVLVIIIIALATVLRYKEYGNQKLLLRLIGAAILVNFSLTIAGVFIDFSNVLTNFFLGKLSYNPLDIASGLAGAFNPQSLFGQTTFTESAGYFDAQVTGVSSLVFIIIFTLLGAFVLLAVAWMFFLRFLHLSFLLIISPIVWLFWVIPGLSGELNTWWKSFLKWVFFMPASSFFIYLTLVSLDYLSAQNKIFTESQGILGGIGGAFGNLTDILSKGAQMIVLSGIMLGGLIIAEKMSIKGAAGAINITNKAGDWAKSKAAKGATALGRRTLTAGLKPDEKTGEFTSFAQRMATGATKIPVVGRAFRGMATGIGNAKAKALETETFDKKYANITNDDLIHRINTLTKIASPADAAAMLNLISKRKLAGDEKIDPTRFANLIEMAGKTGKLDDALESLVKDLIKASSEDKPGSEEKLKSLIATANRHKSKKLEEEVLKIYPHLIAPPGASDEAIKRLKKFMSEMSSDEVLKIKPIAFEDPEVIKNISGAHIERIAQRGSEAQKEAIMKFFDELDSEAQKFINGSPFFMSARKKIGKGGVSRIIPGTEEEFKKAKEGQK